MSEPPNMEPAEEALHVILNGEHETVEDVATAILMAIAEGRVPGVRMG